MKTTDTLLPVVYKNGETFEILPHLDLNRKDEVWGFEIFPYVILAKKCGSDGNIKNTSWENCKAFAEKTSCDGKTGSLPSITVFKNHWNRELKNKIQAMDKFLCENEIKGENRSSTDARYIGVVYCIEVDNDSNSVHYIDLVDSYNVLDTKDNYYDYDRLCVSFEK